MHLREKNIAGPSLRDQQCCALLSSQIGPAFFDEDDVCAGLGSCLAACMNVAIAHPHAPKDVSFPVPAEKKNATYCGVPSGEDGIRTHAPVTR